MKTRVLILDAVLLLVFSFVAWSNISNKVNESIPVATKPEFKAVEVAHREKTDTDLAKTLKENPITPIAKLKVEPKPEPTKTPDSPPDNGSTVAASNGSVIPFSIFRRQGVVYANGYKYTYYSQSVLPGGGLRIPGRHVNEYGYVSDKDGYVVLASNSSISKGSTFNTPFGAGKVYDICANCPVNHLDVYTK